MNNYRSSSAAFAVLFMLTILMAGAMVVALPGPLNARDPGINQPGRAGNVGTGVGVDSGINQPGPAGNVNRRGIGR
jgi:hypothetical protein